MIGRVILIAALTAPGLGCGLVGPSCRDETGDVFATNGHVTAGGVASFTVTSPKSSNLVMRLTWPETAATLGFRATITDCGGHTGCAMTTVTPPFGPGGPDPVPPPWPPGLREMLVDGWRGKTYRVEIVGDPERDITFTLSVVYRIACES
jgi:hypothetical protein